MSEGKEVSGVAPRADMERAADPRATDAKHSLSERQLPERMRVSVTLPSFSDGELYISPAFQGIFMINFGDGAWLGMTRGQLADLGEKIAASLSHPDTQEG